MEDKEYIKRILSGDNNAISSLYQEYRNYFFYAIKKMIEGLHLTEQRDYILDLYQDSVIILIEKIRKGELKNTTNLKSYLVGIGKFQHIALHRKGKVANKYKEEYAFITPISEDQEEFDKEAAIDIVVREMGEPCSTLLHLSYYENKNGSEIANIMGYNSPDSVKTQKFKCMKKLKDSVKVKFAKLGIK